LPPYANERCEQPVLDLQNDSTPQRQRASFLALFGDRDDAAAEIEVPSLQACHATAPQTEVEEAQERHPVAWFGRCSEQACIRARR